jgi:hypothetical protein
LIDFIEIVEIFLFSFHLKGRKRGREFGLRIFLVRLKFDLNNTRKEVQRSP